MKTNGSARNWWRFAVDALVAAAIFLLVFATIDASADGPTLLLPIALIGAGLALEPDATMPRSSTDSDTRSMRLPAGIVDATSA
ncbi:MAG TPA: hypothetical protein VLK83_07005 [Rhodanobacteraceae bacterium]|nr:hypothetical protein [Rhodanobacteraceae bacterium]